MRQAQCIDTGCAPPAARRWSFSDGAAELASLRRIVARECGGLGVRADEVDGVVLAVDELAANARVFGPYELRLYTDPPGWGVADRCPDGAEVVTAGLAGGPDIPSLDESGRGLLIVSSLFPDYRVASTVVPPNLAGKEIRFTFGRGGGR